MYFLVKRQVDSPTLSLLWGLQSWTKQLRQITFQALSVVNKRTTIFHPPPTQCCFLGHEQFPGNRHFPNQHCIGGGGGGEGGEREREVTVVEFGREK